MIKYETNGATGTLVLEGSGEELFKESVASVFAIMESLARNDKTLALHVKIALKKAFEDGEIIDQFIAGTASGVEASVRAKQLQ